MKWALRTSMKLNAAWNRIRKEEKGQALSEYAIIIGVIAVIIIATLILFKDALVGLFTDIISKINAV